MEVRKPSRDTRTDLEAGSKPESSRTTDYVRGVINLYEYYRSLIDIFGIAPRFVAWLLLSLEAFGSRYRAYVSQFGTKDISEHTRRRYKALLAGLVSKPFLLLRPLSYVLAHVGNPHVQGFPVALPHRDAPAVKREALRWSPTCSRTPL